MIYGNLENLNPEFCLTFEEVIIFLKFKLSFVNLHASFCNYNTTKLCYFKTMENLSQNCIHIFGNVIIKGGDEEYLFKLRKVTHIFGTLVIKGTNLKNLNFLSDLSYMADLQGN